MTFLAVRNLSTTLNTKLSVKVALCDDRMANDFGAESQQHVHNHSSRKNLQTLSMSPQSWRKHICYLRDTV